MPIGYHVFIVRAPWSPNEVPIVATVSMGNMLHFLKSVYRVPIADCGVTSVPILHVSPPSRPVPKQKGCVKERSELSVPHERTLSLADLPADIDSISISVSPFVRVVQEDNNPEKTILTVFLAGNRSGKRRHGFDIYEQQISIVVTGFVRQDFDYRTLFIHDLSISQKSNIIRKIAS